MKTLIQFIRGLDKERAFESTRTTFGIMGAAGYAGYLASMHLFFVIISITMLSACWYAVYRVMEVR